MYRFLLSRKWVGFGLLVLVLAALFVQLGRWQFSRLTERQIGNSVVERNLAMAPAPIDDVLGAGKSVSQDLEWRRVTAIGTFDVDSELLVRYQTREGSPGVDVVTPLVTEEGAALLVDRGWLAASNDVGRPPTVPSPPRGEVQVSGWLRSDQGGDVDATMPVDGQVRLISSSAIADTVQYPLYGGYVEMTAVRPPATKALASPEAPSLDSGPHFFYGLQWWFFAALAVGGIAYFAWSEALTRRRSSPPTATARLRQDA